VFIFSSVDIVIYCILNPAVLELYSFFEDSNYVYLVLEMCHKGELYRYMKDHCKPFSEHQGMSCHLIGSIESYVCSEQWQFLCHHQDCIKF